MPDQRRAPCLAAVRIAKRVERQRHAPGDPQFLQKLVGEYQQFGIGKRAVAADHLGVELMELAIASFLRPLVADQRPVRGAIPRPELLPPMGYISSAERRVGK